MFKILLIASAVTVGTAGVAVAKTHHTTAKSHHMMASQPMTKKKNRVAANGRCGGISYGTGARRCNSISGGPSGGLSSKN